MNRREALAALVSLPATARITVARLAPSDVIVLECDDLLSSAQRAQIEIQLAQLWPDRKIVVLDQGRRIKVLEGGPK